MIEWLYLEYNGRYWGYITPEMYDLWANTGKLNVGDIIIKDAIIHKVTKQMILQQQ
jgi:hypothetical protein